MNARKLIVTHNGKDYAGSVMKIENTMLGAEDHGILTCYLHCKAESSGVGVGGYSLDTPAPTGKTFEREGTAFGMDHIKQMMRVVGVSRWEDLPGKHVVVLFEGSGGWGGMSCGIAHVTEDRVLVMKDHAAAWKARAEQDAEATR